MIKFILVAAMTTLLCFGTAAAQGTGFGVGITVGEPTGVCGKYWLTGNTAIDGAAAWSFEGESFHLHGDYLFYKYNVITVEKGRFPLYYGIGGRISLDKDETKAGVRIPVGLNYIFASDPLDIFMEIVPVLNVAPDTEFSFNAAIGIRFFF